MIFVKDSKEGEVVLSLLIDCLGILHLRHDHARTEDGYTCSPWLTQHDSLEAPSALAPPNLWPPIPGFDSATAILYRRSHRAGFRTRNV